MKTIVPGEGIGQCVIGSPPEMAIAEFGNADVSEIEGSKYFCFPKHGIELVLEEGKVDMIWVKFREDGFQTFQGTTPNGVGYSSSVDDVVTAFGRPSDRSELGCINLVYGQDGINFEFDLSGQLTSLSLTSPCSTTWPSEWPKITTTTDSSWTVFAGSNAWLDTTCLLYTSPSPRDATLSRMPSSA